MIHPTAIVSAEAKIGKNVKIGPYAIIDDNVVVGDNCVIEPKAHIQHAEIGSGNYIGENTLIGGAPQDLKYKNESTLVRIGNNNVIREFVTIHRATHEGEATVVGNDNFIMAYVHFAHDCRIGSKVIAINAISMAGHVIVDDGAVISGNVTIHQHCRIGGYSMTGAGSRVSKDVPPFVVIEGNDPKTYGLNKVGLKRNGFTPDRMKALDSLYTVFFREKLVLAEAVKKIENTLPQNEDVIYFLDFVKNSKRGVIR